MIKILARISSEVLYYLGQWTSIPMERLGWWWLYPVYNRLMTVSYSIQKTAGNTKPWEKHE